MANEVLLYTRDFGCFDLHEILSHSLSRTCVSLRSIFGSFKASNPRTWDLSLSLILQIEEKMKKKKRQEIKCNPFDEKANIKTCIFIIIFSASSFDETARATPLRFTSFGPVSMCGEANERTSCAYVALNAGHMVWLYRSRARVRCVKCICIEDN